MNINILCSYLIHSFNYLNPANLIENPTFNLRVSACGHSHGENTVSLQKALTEGNLCILPGNSSFYTEPFEKIDFNEEKNKKLFLAKNNSSIYELIENNSMFALFMQPFIKNGPGKYISEKIIKIEETNLIYSILYSIFYSLNEYDYEDLNSCLYLVKKDKNYFKISRIFSFFFDKENNNEENFIKKYIL